MPRSHLRCASQCGRTSQGVVRHPESESAAAEYLDESRADILAATNFAAAIWCQIWLDNPNGCLNREIRWGTDVVDIFLDRI